MTDHPMTDHPPLLSGPKLAPFGVGTFDHPREEHTMTHFTADFTLHAAVRRKTAHWPEDARYRVVALDQDGHYGVIADVHHIFHPARTVRPARTG